MERKHRATGRKPPGGRRPGAGRPAGSNNALELGEVRALKALGLRVPEGASENQRAYALHTESRIIDVMEGKVAAGIAMAVLKAASTLREEQLGPVKQKVEHSFGDMTDEQLQARYSALVAKGAATATEAAEPGPTSSTEPEDAP